MSETTSRKKSGFLEFDLHPKVQRAIDEAGFEEPRPIQAACIPAVLEGDDVLGLAQTGTGKTAAFVAPILDILLDDPLPGPRALILSPTRELAMQIHKDVETLAKFSDVKSTTIYGGVKQDRQVTALRGKPDIIVACPGRLLDLMEQGHVDLSRIEILVLDEADHMFDIGFLPSVRRIIKELPKDRQNLLFSATMPREIRGLADQLLHKPHVAELAHSSPADTIEHAVFAISGPKKTELLRWVLSEEGFKSAIVFCNQKFRAKRLAEQLSRWGHHAVALQGNMTQGQRDRAMNGFRNGRYDVLVATDVAARGIDVDHISHVINFDVPTTPDAYTHRIGRTGRSERDGKAYTFVAAADFMALKLIEMKIKQKIERREIPKMEVREEAIAKADAARPKRDPEPEPRMDEEERRSRPQRRRRSSGGGGGGRGHSSSGRPGRSSSGRSSSGRGRGRSSSGR